MNPMNSWAVCKVHRGFTRDGHEPAFQNCKLSWSITNLGFITKSIFHIAIMLKPNIHVQTQFISDSWVLEATDFLLVRNASGWPL